MKGEKYIGAVLVVFVVYIVLFYALAHLLNIFFASIIMAVITSISIVKHIKNKINGHSSNGNY